MYNPYKFGWRFWQQHSAKKNMIDNDRAEVGKECDECEQKNTHTNNCIIVD